MNPFLYNTGHLLDTVEWATITLKLKENTATYKKNNYNIKSSDFTDTTVFQENGHINFFHWMSISHSDAPNLTSPSSHTTKQEVSL